MISVIDKNQELFVQRRGKVRSKGSPIISEPENAKSPIAYRYPYGTDNFVLKGKISGVKKSAQVVPARRWKDNSKIERI